MFLRIWLQTLGLFATCLMVALCFASWAQAEYSTLVLQTRKSVGWEERRAKQISGLLVRELARQSLLIAAREELGILTQDQSLRENGTGNETELTLLLTVDADAGGKCEVKIVQVGEKENTEIWTRSLKFKANAKETYLTLTPQFEAFSRGEFVDLLEKLGVEQATAKKKKSAAQSSPEDLQEIEQLLQEVDLFSQFVAVRRLHQHLHSAGESPELLGLLVNGYANLGLLTECTWSPDSRVFKARSFVYAQRLREKYGDYLFSRWHWSYAQAIAGIHGAALEQLKDPIPKQGEDFELPSLPAWGDLVEPYCRYDTTALQSLADQGSRWALYLRLWALYNSGADRQIDLAAKSIMQDCPEAFNIYALFGSKSSIGIMHLAGRASIQAMMQTCLLRLSESQDLPADVRQAALTPPTQKSPLVAWGKVIETLRKEKDPSEFSWPTLANLLEDTAAMVAAADLRMARGGSQEHSMAPYVEMFWPAIKDHPLASFFESCKYSLTSEAEEIQRVCRDLQFEDPNLWIGDHTYYVWNVTNSKGGRIGYDAYYGASRDFTATSLVLANQRPQLDDKTQEMYVRELREVSPRSPMVLVREIQLQRKTADKVKPKEIAAWKELAGTSSLAWYELGLLYVARHEYEPSYECFQKSFEISPSHNTARAWAWAYELAEDFEQVVPTLKRYLEVEDFGLGHSNTHYDIARFYLRQDKPEEAKPHALESAESWSGQGLSIAAWVCDRLKLTEEADQWYQRLSSAYPSYSGRDWYFWRRRSGNPDVAEARELAQKFFGAKKLEECSATGWWPLVYYLMESDHERAMKLLKQRIQSEPGLFSESLMFSLALEQQDKPLADQTFARMKEIVAEKDSAAADDWDSRFVAAIQSMIDAESKDQISSDLLDKLLIDSGDDASMSLCSASYFFAKLLQAKGFTDLATQYRDKTISFHLSEKIAWHLASFETSRLKTDKDSP